MGCPSSSKNRPRWCSNRAPGGAEIRDTDQWSPPLLAIPATLHDSLMARLDRLSSVRGGGPARGRAGTEFSYQLLEAVALSRRRRARPGPSRSLVEAGVPPPARRPAPTPAKRLRSTPCDPGCGLPIIAQRASGNCSIGGSPRSSTSDSQMTAQEQPEFHAHHYTEGAASPRLPSVRHFGCGAGQRAVERSANAEAICHLRSCARSVGARNQKAPSARGRSWRADAAGVGRSWPAEAWPPPRSSRPYARARELCEAVGHSDQLPLALGGLGTFYLVRGNIIRPWRSGNNASTSHKRIWRPRSPPEGPCRPGTALVFLGEPESGRAHLARGLRLRGDDVAHPQTSGTRRGVGVSDLRCAGRVSARTSG